MDDTALSALMTPAPSKAFIENKSRLEHGKRVITSSPKKDERSLTLQINLTAATKEEFFARYESFCEELNFCYDLRNRLIYNEKEENLLLIFLFLLGGRWDSNPRHSEPQSDALTN